MPELPEVETTRRGIEPWLVGRRIESLPVRNGACAGAAAEPSRETGGARIHRVGRRAKYLLIRPTRAR